MFKKVSADTFDELQLDAGVLLSTFDPASPAEPADADIICATTGGVTPTCTPTFSDFAEDIDNVPTNTMEFLHIDGYDCSLGFSSVKFNAANVQLGIGAADITNGTGFKKITPRSTLATTDFKDLWWVGDKADGGAVAIRLKNALSTGGLSITTTKNGKGNIALTISGHVSIANPDDVPMEFYIIEA